MNTNSSNKYTYNNPDYNDKVTKKITLYNLDNEDKSFLKNMEKNNSFIITDISFLNKKNVTNYNISLSNLDIIKMLKYYIYLVQENKKEQLAVMNLKNNIPQLKEQLLNIKKNEINNKKLQNNNNIRQINNLSKNKNINLNINNYSSIDNSDILERYQNDIKYFSELINNINEEMKNI